MNDHENILNAAAFLEKSNSLPVFDVRSPAEFEHGHIPGALNLPLFSNEERSIVGTLYLKKGSSEAMMKGLELIGPKLNEIALFAKINAPAGESLVHCWRGGMRSSSVAWLLNTIGIRTAILAGGYKAYRRFLHERFQDPLKLIVIGGMTGTGKSEVLEEIERKGQQVVHLERLASHKGSAFGHLGMDQQPTTEQFENNLFEIIRRLDPGRLVYIEDESISIGKVFIPRQFFDQMSTAPHYYIELPVHRRIKRLSAEYAGSNKQLLAESVRRIEKRLGYERAAGIINCIMNDDMTQAIELILHYYDVLYGRSMTDPSRKLLAVIQAGDESLSVLADKIVALSDA